MRTLGKYSVTVIVIILLTTMVSMVGCNTCTICGVYVLKEEPNGYLEFRSDGTFNGPFGMFTGHWYADGDKITVTTQWGSGTGRIEGNRFIDSDGRIWVKSGK